MTGAFDGIVVLDLSHVLAGPYCTMLLGDMGASIVKVEEPAHGDHARAWPPFWNGVSSHFLAFNRNKRSVSLNLKNQRGREICLALVRRSDVIVESFSTGVVERLGLDYATVRGINPRAVYCSISGYGRTGPNADRRGYDLILQAYGGMMSVTGEEQGSPVRTGYSFVDIFTGMAAYSAVTTALFQRERTGSGQFIETSLLESTVSVMSYFAVGYLATGKVPGRMGSAHPSLAPYEAFEAEDGHLLVGCNNDPTFLRLCEALDRNALAEDQRFSTNAQRIANRPALHDLLQRIFHTRPTSTWVDVLNRAGVPSSAVQTVADVVNDPQVRAREMMLSIPHPEIHGLEVPAGPFKLSSSPASVRNAPPALGEHTEEVLTELGYSTGQIEEILRNGVC